MEDEGTGAATTGEPTGTSEENIGTTQTGTADGKGQPVVTAQTTTTSGTATAREEETFFDPKDLDPALVPAYKNMQKIFGKKMEAIKQNRQKIDAYDEFSKDPITQMQQMAQKMGYRLTRAEAAAAVNDTDGANNKWEPQTWDDVMNRAVQTVMEKLNPVFSELQTVKKQNIEKLLDDSCPDWRQYEDEMTSLLHEHPTLAKDPVKLYRLALPHEVLETRATQAAIKKLQGKVDASKVGGTSTTKSTTTSTPDKPISFNEAVQFAKAKLAEQGIRGPG